MTTSSVPRNAPGDPSPDRTATHGIIGRPHDPQVASVAGRLRRRGIEPVVLDLSRFRGHGSLSVRDGVPTARNLDLRAVAAWYVRSFPLPLPFLVPHDTEPDASRLRYAAGRERRSFLAGFVAAMQASGALFVNPPVVMAQHFGSWSSSTRCAPPACPCRRRWPPTTRGRYGSSPATSVERWCTSRSPAVAGAGG
jgi:hypothetical protein